MPKRKRKSIGQANPKSKKAKLSRSNETEGQRNLRLQSKRETASSSKATESEEQRQLRLQSKRETARSSRTAESGEQRQLRLQSKRETACSSRTAESEEQRQLRLETMRETACSSRTAESEEQRQLRLETMRETACNSRTAESEEQRQLRLETMRETACNSRTAESEEQRQLRLETMRESKRERQVSESNEEKIVRLSERREASKRKTQLQSSLLLEAFKYDATKRYKDYEDVVIGKMDQECKHCGALKYKNEPPGMCCCNGKVCLPALESPPEPLLSFMSGVTPESKHFLKNVRKYNSTFQMTSFGASSVVDQGGFSTTFKVQGQVYHKTGSLLPPEGEPPKFLQIYFVGNEEIEVSTRCDYIQGVRPEIVCSLQRMFHEHNILIKCFKTALEDMPSDECTLVLNADKRPKGEHPRRFNNPDKDDVAVIIAEGESDKRDIILKKRSGSLQRISETHRLYDALQYPVIFPKGQDGYNLNIMQSNPNTGAKSQKTVSMKQFYAYRLMVRGSYNHILNCRYLFQQFLVDVYAKIEAERLLYIKLNQSKLRSEEYIHLRDAVSSEKNVTDIGKAVILPATFTGSPRQMHEYAMDAMTYVRSYGRPDLFVTFTCNPSWPEILDQLTPGQTPNDRHDVIARVFRQKQQKLINLLTKSGVFGEVRCWMYTIEWQKRGLPHSHNLIWLKEKIKPTQIDDVISAEIPDREADPLLFDIVTKHMIHGPCGNLNKKSPCMTDGKCSKQYPRQLIKETQTGEDGYPKYRRRDVSDGGHTVNLKVQGQEIEVDNKWVVPYSPLLSKIFDAHINVEYCNSVQSIKYICKYINKGSDMAAFGLKDTADEVTQYVLGRYISTSEAVWRIFSFLIHDRHPAVQHLSVHLENGQRVYYTEENAGIVAANPPKTTLTAFFYLCETDDFAKTLLYSEVPRYYTWDSGKKMFFRRKRGIQISEDGMMSSDALGRVYGVHPSNAECFFLRMLLHTVRGPTSFENIKTVEGHVCETYRETCEKLGLLEDDQHLDKAMSEAALSSSPGSMRDLFAVILSLCHPSKPKALWDKYRDEMTADILHGHQKASEVKIQVTPEMYNEALVLIEGKCLTICNKTLPLLGLEAPSKTSTIDAELLREKHYDPVELKRYIQQKKPLLTEEQRLAFDGIINSIDAEEGGIIFLDAPGGTGKTYLLNLILAEVRSRSHIAVAVASSGIAATLMDGGRTAHSALKLPLNAGRDDNPVCNISKSSGQAKVLQACKIIVWDECTMAHKKSLEALDRSLKDLRSNDKLLGGVLLLLAGDFRQTLPVIPKSTPADELNACLKMSPFWKNVHRVTLRKNMRLTEKEDNFAKQLLQMGEGTFPNENGVIEFSEDVCITVKNHVQLIAEIYPNIERNYKNQEWLRERAILAPKNDAVHELNVLIQKKIPGKATEYKSIDFALDDEDSVNFPTEFLNSLNPPGTPPHHLELKVGSVIMLLRNIDPPKLCNGTRLTIKRLFPNVIEATIITGNEKGQDVFIPRLPLIPSDFPVLFKRIQFPVKLAFAMTINKAQGQSIKRCGINLSDPCFSHGQLYVACSRVGSPRNLFILAPGGKTKNVVYSQALN